MGLTNSSVGRQAIDSGLEIRKKSESDLVVALAGNPNVGKSTVFNALTGMNQHTGNWPGKTVANAQGSFSGKSCRYTLVDLPGTYSLTAHSAEEEIARNFICFAKPDIVAVVCDATCLERSMNLVLQTLEITENVIVLINLMDEAKRKGISINEKKLSERLGVPVVGVSARKKKSLEPFIDAIEKMPCGGKAFRVEYPEAVEKAIAAVEPTVRKFAEGKINPRWLSLRLLDPDNSLEKEISGCLGSRFLDNPELRLALSKAKAVLDRSGTDCEKIGDEIASAHVASAEKICLGAVKGGKDYSKLDRRIDRILTSPLTGYPVMLLMLAIIFWLTIVGANYPSELLSGALFGLQDKLSELFMSLNAPQWLHDSFVLGVYRVLAWVVSVMLPPMAIFFPLFTLLEDSGFLPRIAYNLDKPFRLCSACGKQALTMCMGFGCNAAGVIGCRIIDSPRERLLAVMTNSLVPCNGRFPALISIISMFFIASAGGAFSSFLSAATLTGVIALSVAMTFAATKLLSKTILKGVPSSFTLELPPYRRPQFVKTLVRSVFDRTLFVLGRAAAVAAPAGLVIWAAANIRIGDISLLGRFSDLLDPFARLMGLDGVILAAFILGFPANEIVIPIILMSYSALGTLPEIGNASDILLILTENGWTDITAICFILFSLMHWPCSTTVITIKKETGSLKYTLLAAALPTAMGVASCIFINGISKIFGF